MLATRAGSVSVGAQRTAQTAFSCADLQRLSVYFFFVVCLVVVVCFLGQPVTVIFVFCVTVAPFWPVSIVGICSGAATICLIVLVMCLVCPWTRMVMRLCLLTVFVGVQRLPLAARTECGPWGKIVSNELIGASGTVSNLE